MDLEDREQRVVLALAAAGAVLMVLLRAGSPVLLAIGLVMAAALAASARRRSRVATAITAFAMGFAPWGWAFIVGAAYVGLAAWLLLRARQVT